MRMAGLIARYLLGLIFLVFGANKFHSFIPMPAPTGLAGQFLGALFVSHMLLFVAALEVIGGLLLLAGRYVPLALVLLGPVVVNIFLFDVTMDPSGLPIAVVTIVLFLLVFANVRSAFAGVFQAKA